VWDVVEWGREPPSLSLFLEFGREREKVKQHKRMKGEKHT
jgi:hypothetical protein